MSHDMTDDIFADTDYGKLALKRLSDPHPDFRLYKAGWLGQGVEREVMAVTGAVFRRALRGANAGKLCKLVKGTSRTVQLTSAELVDQRSKQTTVTPPTTDNLEPVRQGLRRALTAVRGSHVNK